MKKIEITNSTSVTEIGYDADKKEMEVTFHKTGVYLYSDVSPEEYSIIISTYERGGSIGSVVHQIVKGKPYRNLGKEARNEARG